MGLTTDSQQAKSGAKRPQRITPDPKVTCKHLPRNDFRDIKIQPATNYERACCGLACSLVIVCAVSRNFRRNSGFFFRNLQHLLYSQQLTPPYFEGIPSRCGAPEGSRRKVHRTAAGSVLLGRVTETDLGFNTLYGSADRSKPRGNAMPTTGRGRSRSNPSQVDATGFRILESRRPTCSRVLSIRAQLHGAHATTRLVRSLSPPLE